MKPDEELADLEAALQRIDGLLSSEPLAWARRAEGVSSWSVAEQVDHMLRSVARMLTAADTIRVGYDARIKPDGKASVPGRLLLRAGAIPRGRADAPAEVLPAETPTIEECRTHHEQVLALLASLTPHLESIRSWRGTIPHPLLGDFRAQDWLRFARMHTEHHLAIVDDILAVEAD